jgi:hypothetical protein
MASWSTRRKSAYFAIFLVALIVIVGVPFFFTFYKAPTCSDGKQNGAERGIDCGGACARLCPADYATPRVLWSHSMRVVPGVYNSLAYVQNSNPNVEARSLSYLFKLYDDKGILIAERKGNTFVPAGQKFAVFESGIQAGQRIPFRTTFEFTREPDWRAGTIFNALKVLDINILTTGSPSADVVVKNSVVDKSFSEIKAFIILYDKDNNRVAFSKTVIDSIGAGESKTLAFTWPETFRTEVVRSEIVFMAEPVK